MHGAVPAAGNVIATSYWSGPHGGFVEYYRAMKAMDPKAQICETEEQSTVFLQIMGKTYPYDCVELHKYAKPMDIRAPLTSYEEQLMSYPLIEGAKVNALQSTIRQYSGKNIPIVLTEYGQLVRPMPVADPQFNLSLDEGLLVASQLRQWIDHYLPMANKYLLVSTPFLSDSTIDLSIDPVGLSIDSAMIAGPGPSFVIEPTGQVLGLMAHLAGGRRLPSSVSGRSFYGPGAKRERPCAPARRRPFQRETEIARDQRQPHRVGKYPGRPAERRRGGPGHRHPPRRPGADRLQHGPGPDTVTTVTRTVQVAGREFAWTFPAHSVTLLDIRLLKAQTYPV